MSRNDKLAKLARAVRDWRGAYDAKKMRWRRPPQPQALDRVKRWLAALDLEVSETVELLAGFKQVSEFDAWLRAQ